MTGGGAGLAFVGLVLCFLGVFSIHLQVLAAGFGLGWLAGDLFGTSVGTSITLGLIGAVVVWVLATLVFKAAALFIGTVTGAVIGAGISGLVQGGKDRNIALGILLVVVFAVMSALLADRYRSRALLWLTTVGGAGLILVGLARMAPDVFGFLRGPDSGAEQVVSTLCWGGLAVAGWFTQRRLFPRALDLDREESDDSHHH